MSQALEIETEPASDTQDEVLEVRLRGHHVKNLGMCLYNKEHDNLWASFWGSFEEYAVFDYIINNPNAMVTIVAGTMDEVCEGCKHLESCLSEGGIYGRRREWYDVIMARANGTKVGETYVASDLMDKLKGQNPFLEFIKDFSAIAFIALPADFIGTMWDEIEKYTQSKHD